MGKSKYKCGTCGREFLSGKIENADCPECGNCNVSETVLDDTDRAGEILEQVEEAFLNTGEYRTNAIEEAIKLLSKMYRAECYAERFTKEETSNALTASIRE